MDTRKWTEILATDTCVTRPSEMDIQRIKTNKKRGVTSGLPGEHVDDGDDDNSLEGFTDSEEEEEEEVGVEEARSRPAVRSDDIEDMGDVW